MVAALARTSAAKRGLGLTLKALLCSSSFIRGFRWFKPVINFFKLNFFNRKPNEKSTKKLKIKVKQLKIKVKKIQLKQQKNQLQQQKIQLQMIQSKAAGSEAEFKRMTLEREQHKDNDKILLKPEQHMLHIASNWAAYDDASNTILEELQAVSFKFYSQPATFVVSSDKCVKSAVMMTLGTVPTSSAREIAELAAGTKQTHTVKKVFTMENGMGDYSWIQLMTAEARNGDKAVSMLVYGMQFDCAKTVEGYEIVEELEHVPYQVAKSVKTEDAGWVSNAKYTTVWETHNRTEKKTRNVPVFKQRVLDVHKQMKARCWCPLTVRFRFLALYKGLCKVRSEQSPAEVLHWLLT